MERLDVWFDGVRAAVVEREVPGEEPSLRYTEEARRRWGEGVPLLSVRLPVQAEPWPPPTVRPFLAGLLPEGPIRDFLFRRAKLADDDVFGYLRAFGADCAGALSIVDADAPPPPTDSANVEWLDHVRLEELVEELPRSPLGLRRPDGEVKLSLAGVQAKLVLVAQEGRLGLPLRGYPSTHILKPQPYEASRQGLIVTEAFCMQLSAAAGVRTAAVSTILVAGQPALLVERYDRELDPRTGLVRRVHQEDLCQAAGRMPGLKYQKQGGVGFATAAAVIERNSASPFVDLSNLLRLATMTVLLENGDSHAKNISLLHTPAHTLHLAPAYDVACSTVFIPDDTLAMSVNGKYRFADVGTEDLVAEAARWSLPPAASSGLIASVLERAASAVDPLLEQAHEEKRYEPILDEVAATVRRNVDRLGAGL